MNRKAVAKVLSALPGFRARGSYFLGTCNSEVLSGYALDAPPSGIYISRFVLPAFDRIEFLHMGLGTRIAQFSQTKSTLNSDDLSLLLKNDWQRLSIVRDCQSFVTYLDSEQVEGDYCQWAKYLAYIRAGNVEAAMRVEYQWQSSPGFPRVQMITRNMTAVLEAKKISGWSGVQRLLAEWSEYTVAAFCH